ncbi:hypothetical protein HG530_012767 [Fusarium avenaceum]|nr:hypothetical protein HG530_012767 [Fusarium avenaceum]
MVTAPRVVEVGFRSKTRSFELEEAATITVAHKNIEVLPVVCESNTSNFAKDIDCLLVVKCLGVDDIDVVSLFSSDEHSLTATDWREAQVSHAGHF